jgi:hypothetical protein
MQQREHDQRDNDVHVRVPAIGDRVEISRTGVSTRGTVHYADEIQVLVKWDDGSSSSLRVGRDRFEIAEPGAAKTRSTPKTETRQQASIRRQTSQAETFDFR